jgi:hypothetical protein
MLLQLLVVLSLLQGSLGDYYSFGLVRIPIPRHLPIESNLTQWISLTGRSAYLVTTTLPRFRVEYDPDHTLHRVSRTECEFAVNGGPFQRDGTAVGVVVTNGTVRANDRGSRNVGFGITRDGKSYVLGTITDDSAPIRKTGLIRMIMMT